jgi:hypothetical protein
MVISIPEPYLKTLATEYTKLSSTAYPNKYRTSQKWSNCLINGSILLFEKRKTNYTKIMTDLDKKDF